MGSMDGLLEGWVDGLLDGSMDGVPDGSLEGWIDIVGIDVGAFGIFGPCTGLSSR